MHSLVPASQENQPRFLRKGEHLLGGCGARREQRTSVTSVHDDLIALQQSEWERLAAVSVREATNVHAALGHVLRGYRYLELIHARHVPTARRYKELLAGMIGRMDPAFEGGAISYDDEMASMDAEMGDLLDVAHVDLETFYLFAKTVLDRVAQFVDLYFGPERGLPVKTHEKLRANIIEYGVRRGLVIPAGLREALARVDEMVYEHRSDSATNDSRLAQSPSDMMIAHTENAPGGGGGAVTRPSLTTGQLLSVVDAYLRAVVDLATSNPNRVRVLQKRRVRVEPASSQPQDGILTAFPQPEPATVSSFETYAGAERTERW